MMELLLRYKPADTDELFDILVIDLRRPHVVVYCAVPENIHTHPKEGHWKLVFPRRY